MPQPPSQATPACIVGSSEFSTNYTNFMEFKTITDGVLTIENGYIHNVNDPILSQDVATRAYVLDNAGGDSSTLKSWKNSVQAATTSNLSVLSGTLTIDGVNTNLNDRILVKNQNVLSENGIYLVASGAWTRSIDASSETSVVASGTAIYVLAGSTNANKVFICSTVDTAPTYNPVLYGDDITFTSFGQSTPGGGINTVQYNNAGILDGSAGLTWNGTDVSVTGVKTNSIEALSTSDVSLYTDHEAPIILGNIISPTLSLTEMTAAGVFTMNNQTGNAISLVGTNRVSGTGASISLATGSGSLGGSMYMMTGSSSSGAGPPIVLRPGSGSTTHGNVIINPVTASASTSNTSGSLVVFGGIGSTGSITSGGTITGTQILADGRIFVGSSSNVATPVVMSGDASIVNSGALTLSSVTSAGTYSIANITVDAKGRVISASSGTGTTSGGSNGMIQYNSSGGFGGISNFSTTGTDITGGTGAQLYIGNTNNLTGSIGPLSVAGSAYIARSLIIGETLGAKIPLSSAQIFVGSSTNMATNAVMSGDATISNVGALTLSSVVTAGTYTNANISIDAKGRVMVAASGSSGTPAGAVGALQYNDTGVLGGTSNWFYSTSTPFGAVGPSLYSTGASTMIYVGGQGDISDIPSIYTEGGIIVQKNMAISGLQSSGLSLVVAGTTQMSALAVVSGNVNVTKSLIVSGTISGNQLLPSASILVGSTEGYAVARVMSGDASINSTGVISLASVVTSGTYTNASISVDAKGRVTNASSGSSGTPAGATGALQYNNGGTFGGTGSWSYSSTNPLNSIVSNTLVSSGNGSLSIWNTGGGSTNVPSLYSSGGAYIQKDTYIGDVANPGSNTTNLTVAGASQFNNSVVVNGTNDSIDAAGLASVYVSGGIRVLKSILIEGSSTFSRPIVIASTATSALTVSGGMNVTGTTTATALALSGGLNVTGTSTVTALSVGGGLNVTGTSTIATLAVTGTSSITALAVSGGLNVTGTTTATALVASGGLNVTGTSTVTALAVSGSLNVTGTITGNRILPSGSIYVGSSAGYAVAQAMSGDATMSNVGALTLASIVTAGTYTNANISIDAKGRVAVASNGTLVTPAGSTGSLQYNNGGAFGGSSSWFYSTQNPLNAIASNTLYSTANSSLYIGSTGDGGSNTPSIYTSGGINISKDITVGDLSNPGVNTNRLLVNGVSVFTNSIIVTGTSDSSPSGVYSSIHTSGGVSVDKSILISGSSMFLRPVNVASTVASTSTTTGALISSGGAGIAGNAYVGGNLNVASTSQFTSIGLTGTATALSMAVTGTYASTSTTTGALTAVGGVGIGGALYTGGSVNITSTTASISSTTGALVVSGGAGINGTLSAANTLGRTTTAGAGFIGEKVSFTVASLLILVANTGYQTFGTPVAVTIPSAGIWLVSLYGAVASGVSAEMLFKLTDGTITVAGDLECLNAPSAQVNAPIGWVATYIATGSVTITLQVKVTGGTGTSYVRPNTVLSAVRIA